MSRLLQKELGDIFQRYGRDNYPGVMISVNQIKVTPDLAIAKTYLSFLPKQRKDEVLKSIQNTTGQVRHELGKRIRNQLRIVPELVFYYDDTDEVAAEVERMFENLDIPPEDENPLDSDVYKE